MKNENLVSVLPLKDWRIVQNDVDIQLVEGEEVEVPEKFIKTLEVEGVVSEALEIGDKLWD